MPNRLLWPLLLTLVLAAPAPGQAPSSDAYHDSTARELVARARALRGRQGAEIRSYTALVMQRHAARLRLPLRDRLLGREESVMRVRWSRDGETVVQRLGARSEEMGEPAHAGAFTDLHALFDPDADRIYFGIDIGLIDPDGGGDANAEPDTTNDTTRVELTIGSGGIDANVDAGEDDLEDFWIAHPLAEGSERYYRYRSGDTLTLRLPDGRTVRSVELNAIPRVASFHHLRASLWIEPETGSLVRAFYRPARDLDLQRDTAIVDPEAVDDMDLIPGMFRPIVFDLELMSVEYSLWDRRHWLPHRMSLEGYVRAGVVRMPFEAETAYRIEEVDDAPVGEPVSVDDVLAGWGVATDGVRRDTIEQEGARAVVVQPADSSDLLASELLPPPVWEDAPEFATADELEAFAQRLDVRVPGAETGARPRFELQWLLGGRGLIRYNRVEALSLGVRGVAEHALGRAHATMRLGAADLHPGIELGALVLRGDPAWRVEAYHRLTTVEPVLPLFEAPEPALGLGNSAGALLVGRDDGLYFRETGATLALEPRPEQRQSWRMTAFVEQHHAARRKVEWNLASWLDSDREFDPNFLIDEGLFAGASLLWSPWWGVGSSPQAGIELFVEGVEVAPEQGVFDSVFARGRATGRALLPLTRGLRLGLEAAAGHSWGELPPQYAWFLGGATTVRGYDGGAAAGESMARARLELARGSAALGFALFSDAGWAGQRRDFDADDALLSAGAGVTFMDGLLRIDLARALTSPTGWRVHFHLDALL